MRFRVFVDHPLPTNLRSGRAQSTDFAGVYLLTVLGMLAGLAYHRCR